MRIKSLLNTDDGRAKSMVKKFSEIYHLDSESWQEHKNVFLEWFLNQIKSCSTSTAARKRQWMVQYLLKIGIADLAEKIKASGKLRSKKIFHIDNAKGKSVALLKIDDIHKIIELLREEKRNGQPLYKVGDIAALWIIVGCATGIRPTEWHKVRLISEMTDDCGFSYTHLIKIQTSKKGGHVKRKSEQITRHLTFYHWNEAEVGRLTCFLELLPSEPEDFKKLLVLVQQTLQKVSDKLFPKAESFSLYSCRHLYASEYRRLPNYSCYNLAAALGHSDIINQVYYSDKHDDKDAVRRFNFNLALPLRCESLAVRESANARSVSATARRVKYFGAKGSQRPTNASADW